MRYVDFPPPRKDLVELIGQANQNCPMLVLAEKPGIDALEMMTGSFNGRYLFLVRVILLAIGLMSTASRDGISALSIFNFGVGWHVPEYSKSVMECDSPRPSSTQGRATLNHQPKN